MTDRMLSEQPTGCVGMRSQSGRVQFQRMSYRILFYNSHYFRFMIYGSALYVSRLALELGRTGADLHITLHLCVSQAAAEMGS